MTSEAYFLAGHGCNFVERRFAGAYSGLLPLVKESASPLFTLFDFLEIGDQIYEEIINGYVQGKVV